ncbi:MAG: PAS domain S-box protein [Deltaproteobacteria bacterium]|nr:PAS domain S-box protein [Deltaproteobacteria bacterium]
MSFNFLHPRSLRTRVTLFTLAIFLIGIWLLAFYASRALREDMQRLLGEQQFSAVSYIAEGVNEELEIRLISLENIAKQVSPAILGNPAELQELLEQRPILQSLFNGGVLAYLLDGITIADVPFSTGRMGVNYMDRDHVAAALKEGKASIGRPVMGRKLGAPIVGMTVPIHDARDNVIGALTGVIDLGKPNFLDKITEGHHGKTGEYFLTARQYRQIVITSNKGRIMEVLPAPGVNPLIDRFIQGYEGTIVGVNPNGIEVLSSAKSIPVADWHAAVTMPTEEAFSPIRTIQHRMLLAAIFMTLLVGGLSWWMLRRLFSTMLAATKTLATLSDTNQPPQPLPITNRDEIGQLIGGFNRLLETLAKREAALMESEEKFRTLFENAKDGIFLLTSDGVIVSINAAFAKMHGYTVDELLLMDIKELEAPQNVQLASLRFQRVLAGEPISFETGHYCKNGQLISIEVSSSLVMMGTEKFILGFLRDITERNRAEEKLRLRESYLKAIIENQPGLVWLKNIHSQFLLVNRIFAISCGEQHPDMLLGKTDHDIWPADLAQKYRNDDIEVMKSGKSRTIEEPIFDGGVNRWFETFKNPILDEQGSIIGTTGYARDITVRKQAEEKLLESERKYRLITENTADLISILDMNLHVTYVSPAIMRLRGFTVEEAMAQTLEQILTPESLQLALSVFEKEILLEAGGTSDSDRMRILELEEYKKDGTIVWMEVSLSFLRDKDHKPVEILTVARDITERKRAVEEKIKLEGQLRQAQKMESVGRLAGGVAHDFNNMLGIILGHTEMAMDKVDPAHPLISDLEEIHKAASRSADLTRQLLAFARKQTIAPKVLDLNETVEGMLRMLRRLIGEDVDLAWLPGNSIWQIMMDPSQIDQMLANLCVNARDAIADVGKVTIETGNAVFEEAYCADHPGFVPGQYVLLSVSDSGNGMDDETRDKIFEPFFTTKAIGEGTGLGLSTVYGIVKQNKGFINVFSEPGQGTTFKIHLPRHIAQATRIQKAESPEPAAHGHETILLVEDEPAILKMTKMMLERLGYTVIAVPTPGEAIRTVAAGPGLIDLIMTDVIMPEMNGRDLVNHLLSSSSNLKSLFMSGYTSNVIAHHGVLDPGVNFIQKPFSIKNLAAKVRETLDDEPTINRVPVEQ